MDMGDIAWTLMDEIPRRIVPSHPSVSAHYGSPSFRNQQVTRSSRVAGSNTFNKHCDVFVTLDARDILPNLVPLNAA